MSPPSYKHHEQVIAAPPIAFELTVAERHLAGQYAAWHELAWTSARRRVLSEAFFHDSGKRGYGPRRS
jgi:hypothetical protein